MISWQAGVCFVVAVFAVFFGYVFFGMASGEAAAYKFLLVALALGAFIAGGAYAWRRRGGNDVR